MAKRKNLNVKIDYVSIIFHQATAEEIKKKCQRGEFVSLSRSHGYHESTKEEQESAKTVYIGEENQMYLIDSMTRTKNNVENIRYPMKKWEVGNEIELRDEMAHEFSLLRGKQPTELAKLTGEMHMLRKNLHCYSSSMSRYNTAIQAIRNFSMR